MRLYGALAHASCAPRLPTLCSLSFHVQGNWDGKGGKRRRGGGKGEGAEEDEETEEAGKKPESVYLILKGGRQKSAEYRYAAFIRGCRVQDALLGACCLVCGEGAEVGDTGPLHWLYACC